MFVLPDGQVLSVVAQQSVASAPDVVVVDAARMMTIDVMMKLFMMFFKIVDLDWLWYYGVYVRYHSPLLFMSEVDKGRIKAGS